MKNFYHTLGVQEYATAAEIKKAYKQLALQFHPDVHPGDDEAEERFKEVSEAYQVLSDAQKRRHHDLQLNYIRQVEIHKESVRPYAWRSPAARYKKTKITSRQNILATLYAFGITFLIALLTMSIIWTKQWYDERQFQNTLKERRALFEKARSSFQQQDFAAALSTMSSFRSFYVAEQDIRKFRDGLVKGIISRADSYLTASNFADAIGLYKLVLNHEPDEHHLVVKLNLAEALKGASMPDDAIDIYSELAKKDFMTIPMQIKAAETYRDEKDDPETALEHYMIAHREATDQYKRFYGEAYSLVINERHIPAIHYDLYTGLASLYLRLNDPKMAIKAALWNKYVWPDSTDACLITAKGLTMQGKTQDACQEYLEARKKGWEGLVPPFCQ